MLARVQAGAQWPVTPHGMLQHCGVWIGGSISVRHLFNVGSTSCSPLELEAHAHTLRLCTSLLPGTDFALDLSLSMTHSWWREMTGKSEPQVSFCVWRRNWSAGNLSPQIKILYTLPQRNEPLFKAAERLAVPGALLHGSGKDSWCNKMSSSACRKTLSTCRQQVTELNKYLSNWINTFWTE